MILNYFMIFGIKLTFYKNLTYFLQILKAFVKIDIGSEGGTQL